MKFFYTDKDGTHMGTVIDNSFKPSNLPAVSKSSVIWSHHLKLDYILVAVIWFVIALASDIFSDFKSLIITYLITATIYHIVKNLIKVKIRGTWFLN